MRSAFPGTDKSVQFPATAGLSSQPAAATQISGIQNFLEKRLVLLAPMSGNTQVLKVPVNADALREIERSGEHRRCRCIA